MRVYLDNCCYNRPFDDQSQVKVLIETLSKLTIQQQMREGVIEYVWSEVLDYEVGGAASLIASSRFNPGRTALPLSLSSTSRFERERVSSKRLG